MAAGLCRGTGHDTAVQARGTTRHACDTTGVRPATRHTACHDMVQCTSGLGVVRSLPGRSVCAARVRWVCTLCTQSSSDSVHCSESLFETLFMNTVHEHCPEVFKKIIIIK